MFAAALLDDLTKSVEKCLLACMLKNECTFLNRFPFSKRPANKVEEWWMHRKLLEVR